MFCGSHFQLRDPSSDLQRANVIQGPLQSFFNLCIAQKNVCCYICNKKIGRAYLNYAHVTKFKIIRCDPHLVMHTCLGPYKDDKGSIIPHRHYCHMAIIDRDVTDPILPAEVTSVRAGIRLMPPCPYMHILVHATPLTSTLPSKDGKTEVNIPLCISDLNETPNIDLTSTTSSSNSSEHQSIDKKDNKTSNQNTMNEINSNRQKRIHSSPVESDTSSLKKRCLNNGTKSSPTNKIAFVTAFHPSLNDEPSTSDGRYARTSINKAITQAIEKSQDDNVDTDSLNLEPDVPIPITQVENAFESNILVPVDHPTSYVENANVNATTSSFIEHPQYTVNDESLASMINLSIDLDFINDEDMSSIFNISPVDSQYITPVLNDLWENVVDHVFNPTVTGHYMFYRVLNRLINVNEKSLIRRSIDELQLIAQYIVNSYADEQLWELLHIILK